MKAKQLVKVIVAITLLHIGPMARSETGNEGAHGGNAVVKDGKASLLDLNEFEYKFYFPAKRIDFANLSRLKGLLHDKLDLNIIEAEDLVWTITTTPLEKVHDEGSFRLVPDGKVVQVAIQRDGVVVLQDQVFNSLSVNDQINLLLHEMLIATAHKHYLILRDSEIGTGPIRKLIAVANNESADALPKSYFKNIWAKLPSNYGSVSVGESGEFVVSDPRVLYANHFYAPADSQSGGFDDGWCVYFAKIFGLANASTFIGYFSAVSEYRRVTNSVNNLGESVIMVAQNQGSNHGSIDTVSGLVKARVNISDYNESYSIINSSLRCTPKPNP